MKILLSEGLSYFDLSLAICGYLPYSRRIRQKSARNHPQGHSQKFRELQVQRTRGTNAVKGANGGQSGGRVASAVDIDRLPGDVAIAREHHGNIGNLLLTTKRGNQFIDGRPVLFVVQGNVGAGVCKRNRNRPSDATAAARDQGNLSAEIHALIKPPPLVFISTRAAIRIVHESCANGLRVRADAVCAFDH